MYDTCLLFSMKNEKKNIEELNSTYFCCLALFTYEHSSVQSSSNFETSLNQINGRGGDAERRNAGAYTGREEVCYSEKGVDKDDLYLSMYVVCICMRKYQMNHRRTLKNERVKRKKS